MYYYYNYHYYNYYYYYYYYYYNIFNTVALRFPGQDTTSDNYKSNSKMPFKWRFAVGSIVTHFCSIIGLRS